MNDLCGQFGYAYIVKPNYIAVFKPYRPVVNTSAWGEYVYIWYLDNLKKR